MGAQVVGERTQAILASVKGGKSLGDSLGAAATNSDSPPHQVTISPSADEMRHQQQTDLSPSSVADLSLGAPDAPTEEALATQAEAVKEAPSSKEEIVVTDHQGHRRKITVDYNDKEAIKKFARMAAGARKWQAEKDQALAELKTLKPQYDEISSHWKGIEEAYQSEGLRGLVNFVEGDKSAWDRLVAQEIKTREWRENASPEQLKAYESQQEAAKARTQEAKLLKRMEELEGKIKEGDQRSSQVEAYAVTTPAFEEYRFAGKLGDTQAEHMLDTMLWDQSLKSIAEYEEKGGKVSPALAKQEFRKIAMTLRKYVNGQASSKANEKVSQIKAKAAETVQAKAKAGFQAGDEAKEAQRLMRTDMPALIRNWGKYGKYFSRK